MREILVICPSRGRPKRAQDAIDSWKETTAGLSDFVLMVDDDDKELPEYQKIEEVIIRINKTTQRGAVSLHNKAVKLFPDYQYYMPIADDNIFRTKNWDKVMIDKMKEKGWGIVYGDDLFDKGLSAMCPIFSANIIKTAGYISPPDIFHLWADVAWKDIGEGIGRLFYLPEVVVEHMHPNAKKAEDDDGYKAVHSRLITDNDQNAYSGWKSKEYPGLIEKLKKL